jgi:ribosomal protein S18 acetylase RimI-like enzyme
MPVRPAIARDAEFLWRILLEAYNWNGEQRFTAEQIVTDPHAARYLTGWPRRGDFGIIAETDTGEPIGAAWARYLPVDEPGYGYVAPDVPELSLGVLPGHRGHGHGRALMESLIRAAAERPARVARLSLSVEDGNPAVHLYTSLGFTRIGRNGGSDTMVLDVRAAALRESFTKADLDVPFHCPRGKGTDLSAPEGTPVGPHPSDMNPGTE